MIAATFGYINSSPTSMPTFRLFSSYYAALAVLAAVYLPLNVQAQQSGLPRSELTAGMHVIQAEIADQEATRRVGLMHRKALPANGGMLFVFDYPEKQCFWMRNTPLPLSIAFIAEDGSILNIEDMAPQTDATHCSTKPVRYALEMNQGWFDQKGIAPGHIIKGLP